jgi:hypothetical protein
VNRIAPLVFILFSCCRLGSDLLVNWSFSVWDETTPRGWTLVSGEVQRAPTWHPRDLAVEFVSTGTTLTQASELAFACLRVDVIADVTIEAALTFSIDVQDDGVIDEVQTIPSSQWEPVSFQVKVKDASPPLRVTIEKRGEGRAVLANLRITECN